MIFESFAETILRDFSAFKRTCLNVLFRDLCFGSMFLGYREEVLETLFPKP
jgi:hypothetical protein